MVDGPNGDAGVTVSMENNRDKDHAAIQSHKDLENHAMELLWKRNASRIELNSIE